MIYKEVTTDPPIQAAVRRLGSGDTSGSCEVDIPGERTRTDDFDISDQVVDDGQGSGSCDHIRYR
jgi:hypothetical protein